MLELKQLYSPRAQVIQQAIALALIAVLVALLAQNVGWPPTLIVGVSASIGFFCWRATNLRRAIDPQTTAILFLATVAALHAHMFEEHATLFGPAMSRLFGIAFSDESFLRVFVFALPVVYYLTAIGLLLSVPLAGFVAWFIFIGPGMAEFTHFIFPLITPALEPGNPAVISAAVGGHAIEAMPNHHLAVTGRYYFPGMYTAVLPMLPGIGAVWWLFRNRRADARAVRSTAQPAPEVG
jgi:hypothetical protein